MDTDTQPVHISVIRQINQAEGLAPQPPATLINSRYSLVFLRKYFLAREKSVPSGSPLSRLSKSPVSKSAGQTFPSSGSATINNCPACFCFHSCPETVCPAAFNVAGLKSSFTHNTLPCNFKTGLIPASMNSIAVNIRLAPHL